MHTDPENTTRKKRETETEASKQASKQSKHFCPSIDILQSTRMTATKRKIKKYWVSSIGKNSTKENERDQKSIVTAQ
jgi:hypothetical protein